MERSDVAFRGDPSSSRPEARGGGARDDPARFSLLVAIVTGGVAVLLSFFFISISSSEVEGDAREALEKKMGAEDI